MYTLSALAATLLVTAPTIYVQPYGDFPAKQVELVRDAITRFYAVSVLALPGRALPKRAYYPPRRRYRAEKLLDDLREQAPADALRVIGVTEVDISTTSDDVPDWGVLGLGDLDGKASVISTFRCKKKAQNHAQVLERLAKVAVHEVGHTMGLDHCTNQGCVMHDAEGKVATVDHERDLCASCRAKLHTRGIEVAKDASPWRMPTP